MNQPSLDQVLSQWAAQALNTDDVDRSLADLVGRFRDRLPADRWCDVVETSHPTHETLMRTGKLIAALRDANSPISRTEHRMLRHAAVAVGLSADQVDRLNLTD
ncbi:hypothetical protein [Rhizohabitans arisaemae]|uniref:hypothetical protein n=1 Tax=Rhizohabitans arisaemae TaxID=2720610 RepID=UPI0024B0B256|nr:hypothetical protein [Rhizohabitans arisaemae]